MAQGEKRLDRRGIAAAVSLTAIALGLRLAGIRWGLPNADHYFSYHPDEVFLLLPSFRFAVGNFNPAFFNYGTLYLYLVGLPAVALGLVPDADVFPRGLRALYVEARLITALLGAATVPMLYFALRHEGSSLAFLSSALLAVCPLHVVNSHYATVDVPATFFLILAFLLALRGAKQPGTVSGMLAGFAVGLAAATKYNAALFLIPAMLAPLVVGREKGSFAAWCAGVPVGAALGFVAGNPYFWTEEFKEGIRFELSHARRGGTLAFVGTGSGWVYHLTRGLPVALGYPLLLAAGLGAIAAIVRRSPATRLCLLWIAIYLFVIGFGKERFIRYLVPVTPFLAVLAGAGLLSLVRLCKRPRARAVAGVVAIGIVLLTAGYAFGQVLPFVWMDTRDSVWYHSDPSLRDNQVGLAQAPWFYHPPISPYNAGAFSRRQFEKWNELAGHRVAVTGWNAEALAPAPPYVFCLSDLEARDPLRLGDAAAVGLVSTLENAYAGRRDYDPPPTPFSWLAPGRRRAPPDWLYTQPHITVYYDPRQ